MKKIILALLLGCLLTLPALAQTGQGSSNGALATWLNNAYRTNRTNILKSAENAPEDIFGMRPGPQMEVRTYGQIVGHLANFNYLWCSQAKGEKNPNAGNNFEKVTTKDGLVKAIQGAFNYCDGVYDALTDASGMQMVEITQENGRKAEVPRMSLLILNYGHNNEHYGNLVTYMRIKSIVPPSSQPR
ncbi:MAG TPA: DinB family protein [Candidatus Acidoferrales bacterium]|nr:DinB family protein [Candidatus Acidoferrales bacterium]